MKFKELTPGMVIHCSTESDANALLEHLDKLGYEVSEAVRTRAYSYYREETCFYLNPDISVSYGYNDFYKFDKDFREQEGDLKITEFTDLIEPDKNSTDGEKPTEMSAAEVLEWFAKADYGMKGAVFDEHHRMVDILHDFKPQEIVDKIIAYEAARKTPSPASMEVEWVTRYGIYDAHEGTLMKYYDDLTETEFEEEFKKYVTKHGAEYYAKTERRCRVKEKE